MDDIKRVVAVSNLREFFRDSLAAAMTNQSVDADDHTTHYIVNLLTMYARSEELYDTTSEGLKIKPLAFMLGDALEADSDLDRDRALRRLGDVALFMAGFFAHSFSRKMMDIDYYISMGGGAYGHLSETNRNQGIRHVFVELAEKFQCFVDVLNEISAMGCGNNDQDILRLYEIWMRTGSIRAAAQLRSLGVEPSLFAVSLKAQ